MTPEMVERVARAMCRAKNMDPDTCVEGSGAASVDGFSISVCHRRRWEWYIADARAAIAAMREPTKAIGDAILNVEFDNSHRAWANDVWATAIDAALQGDVA